MQKRRHLTGMHAEFMPPILSEREQDIKMLRPYLTNGLMGIKRLREHIYKLGGQSQVDSVMADLDKLMAERPLVAGFNRIYEIVEDFLAEPKPRAVLIVHLLNEMTRDIHQEAHVIYEVKHNFYMPPPEHCARTNDRYIFTFNTAATGTNIPQEVSRIPLNRAERRSSK